MSEEIFTQEQGTEYAVMLLIRKLRRIDPAAYGKVMSQMPEEARWALGEAEMRADTLRLLGERDRITRDYAPRVPEPEDES